jgi:hypothetical protein
MPEIGTVVETRKTLLTTYEVTDKHYCINERGNPLPDVLREIRKALDKELLFWSEGADYFNVYPGYEDKPWPLEGWIKVFYVKGGSEGYYVHVEVRNELILLGKTLREGEAGRHWAEQMVCVLSEILEV